MVRASEAAGRAPAVRERGHGPAGMNANPLRRLERDALVALAALAIGAWAVRPDDVRVALGVAGGGLLAVFSYRAVRGGVEAALAAPVEGGGARRARARALVKFFTRHAILAAAAYGMMARLELDPAGMLVGAAAFLAAAAVEARRAVRASPPRERVGRPAARPVVAGRRGGAGAPPQPGSQAAIE